MFKVAGRVGSTYWSAMLMPTLGRDQGMVFSGPFVCHPSVHVLVQVVSVISFEWSWSSF